MDDDIKNNYTVNPIYKHSLDEPLDMLVNRLFLYSKIEYRVISGF